MKHTHPLDQSTLYCDGHYDGANLRIVDCSCPYTNRGNVNLTKYINRERKGGYMKQTHKPITYERLMDIWDRKIQGERNSLIAKETGESQAMVSYFLGRINKYVKTGALPPENSLRTIIPQLASRQEAKKEPGAHDSIPAGSQEEVSPFEQLDLAMGHLKESIESFIVYQVDRNSKQKVEEITAKAKAENALLQAKITELEKKLSVAEEIVSVAKKENNLSSGLKKRWGFV